MGAHQHGQGYYVKTPSIEECTELYRGNKIQLVGAIDLSNDPAANSNKDNGAHENQVPTARDLGQTANGQALNNSTALLFTEIASLAKSDIVVRAVQTINSRLRFIRVIEAGIIEGVDHELNDMHSLMLDKNYNELRNHVGVNHDKRLSAVNDIVDASFARAFRQ